MTTTLPPVRAFRGAAVVLTRTGTRSHLILGGSDPATGGVSMFTACGRNVDGQERTRTLDPDLTPCGKCLRSYIGRVITFLDGLAQIAGLPETFDVEVEAFRGYRILGDFEAVPAVNTRRLEGVARLLSLISGEAWPHAVITS